VTDVISGLKIARSRALILLASFAASAGAAQAPWWHIDAVPNPTNLAPGSEAEIEVIATNLGDAYVNAGKTVTVADTLPASLKVTKIRGELLHLPHPLLAEREMKCPSVAEADEKQSKEEAIECTYGQRRIGPYEGLIVKMVVQVEAPEGPLANTATVSGCGAASPASYSHSLNVTTPTPFGVSLRTRAGREAAEPSLAGSHPFQRQATSTSTSRGNSGRRPASVSAAIQ
jgi:hypothetical protein